jgi:Uma2 family endonuclease
VFAGSEENDMVNFVNEKGEEVRVPEWVQDLDAFRRWVEADDYPETGDIWYYRGEVWVDMSREQLFTHGAVKNDMVFTLTGLAKALKTGRVWTDGVLLTNDDADLGCMPDLLFVSHEAFQSERVRLIEGMDEGYVEIEGSPDMTLEIVSRSSVRKDRVLLRQAYWEAGVREYWIVDARQEPLTFDILRYTAKGYVTARKQDGWVKSAVFGKSFRLTQGTDALEHPEYTPKMR